MITTADRLSDVRPYYFSTKLAQIAAMNEAGADVINLGVGSPDLPPPPAVIARLQKAATEGLDGYQPYKGIPALRRALAGWYQRHHDVDLDPDQQILPLMGSKEGIMHISMALLNAGDEVLVPNPGYPAYSVMTRLAGGLAIPYSLVAQNGYLPDLAALSLLDLERVKIMYLGYPHMPTGATISYQAMAELVAWASKHEILLVHDNPYGLLRSDPPLSILEIPGALDTAVELTSLSKNYHMPGWRVGCLAGHRHYIDAALQYKSNMDSGMYGPIQEAAIVALEAPDDWLDRQQDIYQDRRRIAYQLLDQLGCRYQPCAAGLFVWAAVPDRYTGESLSDLILVEAKVFMTPGVIFGTEGKQHVRLSLCTPADRLHQAHLRIKTLQL